MAARKKTPTFVSGDSFALESTAPNKPKKESKKERVARLIADIVGANKEWNLETVDFSDPNRPKTCLEVDFPIVPINAIAQVEMSSGATRKPIYQMSKWWARRSSIVFRSLLLAAATKAPDDQAEAASTIWKAFYGNHQKNESFRKLKVADIFMGGGTTLVEGSRLGFELFGCDLNPVAWFAVKNELTPVDLDELKRLLAEIEAEVRPYLMPYFACDGPGGEKGQWFQIQGGEWQSLPPKFDIFSVSWEDRPQYRYEGPEIIYTFWAKHGPCSAHGCGHRSPLLTTPVFAIKQLTVPAWLDHECPECNGKFDIERYAARMAPDAPLAVAKTERPFAVLDERGGYACPHCSKEFSDRAAKLTGESGAFGGKPVKKKIPLTLLMHPQWLNGCGSTDSDGNPLGGAATDDAESTARWYKERAKNLRMLEFRGTLPDKVTCPETGVEIYTDRRGGNVPGNGKFACAEPSCGRQQETLPSIKSTEKTGPKSPFVFQGLSKVLNENGNPYGGRFFALVSDPSRSEYAQREWQERKEADLADFWPRSELCYGFMTHMNNGGIPNHGYTHWWKMFNPVQLLIHSQILKAVQKRLIDENNSSESEAVLGGFQQYLRNQNLFSIWNVNADQMEPMFSNSNFHPKATTIENNVFNSLGRGNWSSCVEGVLEGMHWTQQPWESVSVEMLGKHPGILVEDLPKGRSEKTAMWDLCLPTVTVENQSCTELTQFENASHDLVITDPPFGGLLHYSELSDFFYVWLRLVLKDKYPKEFGPEHVPKALEAVANRARQGSMAEADAFYQRILTDCWREAHRILKPAGILAFTFHHSEDEPWVAVLESLFEAGFYLEATYPIRSDETKGEGSKPGTFGSQQIEYDIIHVCRKQTEAPQPVSWARLRRRIAADVKQLQGVLTHHRAEGLPEADLKVIRRGKALEYFSKHYGQVYVEEGRPIDLRLALAGINQLLDDEHTPPADVPPVTAEALTRQFLRLFTRRNAVARDEVQKTLRGTGIGPADFEKKGWCKEEKKVFCLVHPLEWARAFKGVNRKQLSRDLDQSLFLIGACWRDSGIRVADTLGSQNFKHHPAIPDILGWFVSHGVDFEIKSAAANALQLYKDWMERNKSDVQEQLLLFGEDGAA
jgi:putative DNA methylase